MTKEELKTRAFEILDNAKKELRELTEDEVKEIDTIKEEIKSLDDEDKKERELRPYLNIDDNFTKIIVTKNSPTYRNENGILIIGLKDFLLNPNSLDL